MKLLAKLSLAAVPIVLCAVSMLSQDSAPSRGKEIYAIQKCALCHSISGVGGQIQALDGVGSRLKPDTMRRRIRTPRELKPDSIMKAYPDLPEKDLNNLVEYLMTLR